MLLLAGTPTSTATMTTYRSYHGTGFGAPKKLHPELEDPAREILERDLAHMAKYGATTILRAPYEDLNELELAKTLNKDVPDGIKAFAVVNIVPKVTNVRIPLTEKQFKDWVKRGHVLMRK